MPFNARRLRVNGVELNVVIEGAGPPVLLVHGFPDSHQVWRQQIPVLVASGYQVIAPDLRGFGASEAPPHTRDYRLPSLVADLVALLDALGLSQVRLVGHDWGAVIGWRLCMDHPERIDRFAALSVGHPTAYARAPLEQKIKGYYVFLIQLRGLAEALLRAGGWRAFRWMTRYDAEFPLWVADLARPGRLTAGLNYYRANFGMVLPTLRPSVAVPVMGVWSSGDIALCEAQMTDSRRFVTGSWRYERLEGVNHWLQLDAPERTNELLLDFLR